MHDYTNTSATSSVTGARHSSTEVISISARPQITYFKPNYDLTPRIVSGFLTVCNIEGYNFDKNVSVYVSAGKGVYTNSLSAITGFDLFGSLSGLSALYPAFSGFKVPNNDWHVTSPNTINL